MPANSPNPTREGSRRGAGRERGLTVRVEERLPALAEALAQGVDRRGRGGVLLLELRHGRHGCRPLLASRRRPPPPRDSRARGGGDLRGSTHGAEIPIAAGMVREAPYGGGCGTRRRRRGGGGGGDDGKLTKWREVGRGWGSDCVSCWGRVGFCLSGRRGESCSPVQRMTSGSRRRDVGPAGVGDLWQATEVLTAECCAETAVTVEVVQFATCKRSSGHILGKQLEADCTLF